MNSQTLVTLVVPMYNAGRDIARCLASLTAQTHAALDIVVVDDASTDGCAQLAQDFAQADPRVRVLRHERNRGTMAADRTGYEAARGDYLLFVGSDDTLPPDAIATLVGAAQASGADLVCANLDRLLPNGRYADASRAALPYGDSTEGLYHALATGHLSHSLCDKLFARRLFAPAYETVEHITHATDLILFYQIVPQVRKAVVIPDVVYHWTLNYRSVSWDGDLRHIRERTQGLAFADRVLSAYPSLDRDRIRFMERALSWNEAFGLPRAQVQDVLRACGMAQYLSLPYLMAHLPPADAANILAHRAWRAMKRVGKAMRISLCRR